MNDPLDLFRASPKRVASMRHWLKSKFGTEVLRVLEAKVPQGFPMRGQAVTDTQANIELGRVEGYRDCLRVLVAMAVSPAPESQAAEIPSTYAADNDLPEEE